MFKHLNRGDFYLLKDVAFNRLHPYSQSNFYMISIIVSLLFGGLPFYVVYMRQIYSETFLTTMVDIYVALFMFQIILVLFFVSKKRAVKYQRFQSVMLSFIAIKISIDPYLSYFFIIVDGDEPPIMMTLGIMSFVGGFVFLIISIRRAIMCVNKGEFKRGGRGLINIQHSKGYLSIPIIFIAVVLGRLVTGVLASANYSIGLDNLFFLFICVVIQYGIYLAIPEFMLLAYCKYRFGTFNYNPQIKES